MPDDVDVEDEEPKKKSKKPLLFGVILALILGGGGFYAVQANILFAEVEPDEDDHEMTDTAQSQLQVSFIPVQPVTINLGDGSGRHLRFRAQLEVRKGAESEVEEVLPRVVDILNSYLRAVGTDVLENPSALARMRGHMLRRVQLATGQDRVRDILIMEFVLN